MVLSVGFIQAGLGVGEGIFQGVFHAIMAFCNAGFATLPGDDLLPYAGNWLVVGSLVCVITLGGLGFPVLVDLYSYRGNRRLSVHSRVVLITSAVLVVVGVLSVALLEWTNPTHARRPVVEHETAMSLFRA